MSFALRPLPSPFQIHHRKGSANGNADYLSHREEEGQQTLREGGCDMLPPAPPNTSASPVVQWPQQCHQSQRHHASADEVFPGWAA